VGAEAAFSAGNTPGVRTVDPLAFFDPTPAQGRFNCLGTQALLGISPKRKSTAPSFLAKDACIPVGNSSDRIFHGSASSVNRPQLSKNAHVAFDAPNIRRRLGGVRPPCWATHILEPSSLEVFPTFPPLEVPNGLLKKTRQNICRAELLTFYSSGPIIVSHRVSP